MSERLGIEYYDSEIIKKSAGKEGLNPEIFRDMEEKKPSMLKALLQGAYGIADNFHATPLSEERVYKMQSKVIKDLCKKGSCVIVGRNADYILRHHPNLISIFLHSPIEKRVERIMKRKEASSETEALDLARKNDKRRESFYNFYTGDKKWGLSDNYHLSIDTSVMDAEGVVNLIISFINGKRQK